MEIKCLHQDIGKTGGIPITEAKSTTIFMIQKEECTMLTTNGIHTLDGALKNQVAKLLRRLTLILTFKTHIMITMIQEVRKTIGQG